MTPQDALALALAAAEEGLAQGELPIGAVVLDGDTVLARAHTQERALGRRIVHADLMALVEADARLGPRPGRGGGPLTLAVSLEPCLMCMGAAMTLGIERVWFGLESPHDGAVALLDRWDPPRELPFFRRPAEITRGVHRNRVRQQFARFAGLESAPAGMRAWARGLAGGEDAG